MTETPWYYCLTHHVVEPWDGCKAADRLGPYRTPEEAAKALQTVAERNEEWAEDPRFNDPEDADEAEDDWDRDSEGWGPFKH